MDLTTPDETMVPVYPAYMTHIWPIKQIVSG